MAVESLFSVEGWETTTLGEACKRGGGEIQTGPFGSQLHAADYVTEGIPSIMPQNIGDNRINEQGIARITPADAARLSRYLVREGDIVYSRRGDVERKALVRRHEDGWLCGTGCLRVRFGSEEFVNSLYASFYLSHADVRSWIVRHAHGATMPNLNTSILGALPFVIPPIAEQLRIAHILGTLDDKIELNRRQNETLESLARALFQSWFVNFDPVRAKASGEVEATICQRLGLSPQVLALFPAALEDSGLGEVPAGWKVEDLGDSLDVIETGRRPKGGVSGFSEGVPSVGAESIVGIGRFDFQKTKYVPSSFFASMKSGLVASEDVLLYKDGGKPGDFRPRVSMFGYGFPFELFAINEHVFRLRSNKLGQAFLYMQIGDERVLHELRHRGAKAAIPGINQGDVKSLKLVVPSTKILALYNETASAIFRQILQNASSSQQLVALRDELLPRLLSGELSTAAVTEEVYG